MYAVVNFTTIQPFFIASMLHYLGGEYTLSDEFGQVYPTLLRRSAVPNPDTLLRYTLHWLPKWAFPNPVFLLKCPLPNCKEEPITILIYWWNITYFISLRNYGYSWKVAVEVRERLSAGKSNWIFRHPKTPKFSQLGWNILCSVIDFSMLTP